MNESREIRIEKEAEKLFAPGILLGLKEWYEYALKDTWKYVVFAVRRSYVLALIMEKITGKKMEESSSAIFLTDAAFFLHCSELAEYYKQNKQFPAILLCDDVMIHGRNINHIISGIEAELCRLLRDENEEEEKIKAALAEAVTIHIFMRNWDSLLLFSRYGWNLHYICEGRPAVFHQLASDIATLISCANITNAAYIYTEYLSDQEMKKVNLEDYISTSYQNMEQYSKCIYVGNDNGVKAILALRLIKNVRCDGYRAAPFVFLPNLDAEETNCLVEKVLRRIPEKDRKWVKDWDKLPGKRSFNELLSLLLSNAILHDFNRTNNILIDKADAEEELLKLSRNYDQFGLQATQKRLSRLLSTPLFTLSELEGLLEEMLPEGRIVMRLENSLTSGSLAVEKKQIKKNLEGYFYARGYVDEMSAYELMNLPYFPTERRSKRRARGCGFTLLALNKGYTMAESQYCIAYVQQMMDVGVIGISSYAPNDVIVVGFAQFAKAGEQSLLLEPLQWDIYIPMLARMQFECDRWRIPFIDELEEYGAAYPELYSSELIEALVRFVKNLKKIGQTPDDWLGNYLDRIDLGMVDNGIDALYEYVSKREGHRDHYKAYAKEKFY